VTSILPSRRDFLKAAGRAVATVPLIGTAIAQSGNQPTRVAALKGSAKSVAIPTHEYYGDLDERLDFPADWEINVMNMKGYGAPVLTNVQIEEGLSKPIKTLPLREIAAGKRTVVITFDDLTRATPAYKVAPWVVGQLKSAGIKDEDILFLGSFATHRPMTSLEVQKKLGKEIAGKYAWLNHSCFYGTKEIGTTSFKNKIQINQNFLAADLKITISGIKVHYDAGYGGGAKAILPGVAHIDTIDYNHNVLLRQTKTAGPVRVFKNEMRLDMIEAARMAKVDFSVQIMYDQKLRPTHVFSGNIVDAHHAAVRLAANTYCTPTFKDADIVVTNGYPQNAQAFHAQRWINLSLKKEGGTGVLIVQHPLTLDPIHFLNNRTMSRNGASYYDMTRQRVQAGSPANSGLIVYSQYVDRTMMNNYSGATHFATKWEDVMKILKERHKGTGVQVAVYPYGGMQHQEIELDG
jgi:nickel-dependent lactate racemase